MGPPLSGAGQAPQVNIFKKQDSTMARTIQCTHLHKEGEGLDFAPYPGELGKRIYNEISKEAWQLWMKHQTMLVNENRLNLADARAPVPRPPDGKPLLRRRRRCRPGLRAAHGLTHPLN